MNNTDIELMLLYEIMYVFLLNQIKFIEPNQGISLKLVIYSEKKTDICFSIHFHILYCKLVNIFTFYSKIQFISICATFFLEIYFLRNHQKKASQIVTIFQHFFPFYSPYKLPVK